MLYDSMFSLDLPARPGPPVRAGHAIENLLFTGRTRALYADCTLSSAVVLSRCYHALRGAGMCDLRVFADADEIVQLPICPDGQGEPRWPDRLPPEWTEQPCDFGLRAAGRGRGLVTVVHLRYSPRHLPERGALTGAFRLLWDVEPPADLASFESTLVTSIAGDPGELRRRLEANGHCLLASFASRLAEAFAGAPVASRGSVVLLHGFAQQPNAFADLLAGFPAACLAQIPVLERIAATETLRWHAMDSRGVRGRLLGERFVPVEEVTHAS